MSSWKLFALISTSNSKWAFKLHGSCVLFHDEPHYNRNKMKVQYMNCT